MQTTAQTLVFIESCNKERKSEIQWEHDWGFLRNTPKIELPADFDPSAPRSNKDSEDPVLSAGAGFQMGCAIADPPQRASHDVLSRYTSLTNSARLPVHIPGLDKTAKNHGEKKGAAIKFPEHMVRAGGAAEYEEWKKTGKTLDSKSLTVRKAAIAKMKEAPTRDELGTVGVVDPAGMTSTDVGQTMMKVMERSAASPTKRYGSDARPLSTTQEVGWLVAKGRNLEVFGTHQFGKKSVKFT
eukprot:ANDGO_00705.mRNA.1 hypothetical protein